jgi:hypothetical protein
MYFKQSDNSRNDDFRFNENEFKFNDYPPKRVNLTSKKINITMNIIRKGMIMALQMKMILIIKERMMISLLTKEMIMHDKAHLIQKMICLVAKVILKKNVHLT